ncbi:hypothetical protein GCM10023346_33200 [Arthrobacter gyeryongensis]|uniref:DNA primase/nucleoside triphosphatase C-terminal domain-containing protein n=1 Tax=Arthrobacter gyeryongensis TaxID=1650592 RepID=A0ABP9SNB5_9MICC
MTKVPLDNFLNECVSRNSGEGGLSFEELYGLYVSWCGLKASEPVRARTFRASLRAAGIAPGHRGELCEDLVMIGPAACDYIVHSVLPLAALDARLGRWPRLKSWPAERLKLPVTRRAPGEDRDSAPAA